MRGRRSTARGIAVLGLAAAMLVTAGCGGSGGADPSVSPAPTTAAQLCADDHVAACSEGPDSLTVELIAAATDEEAVAFAQDARAVGESAGLDGGVTLQLEGPDASQLDIEISSPPRWTVRVFPGDGDDVMTDLERVIEVAAVPGTTGISLDTDGRPTVMVLNLSEFEWVFTSVKELPLFQEGGTYELVSDAPRLRIVHVPDRMSDETLREVIAIAIAYPDAEVVLDESAVAPYNPELSVSGLAADEVTALDARLSDPALADAGVEGYAVSYVLASVGTNGTEYTGGTFGGVPAD